MKTATEVPPREPRAAARARGAGARRSAPNRLRPRGRALFALTLTLGSLVPLIAEAQAPSAAGEQLFVEGRALMKEGKYAQAAEKFKASYALDISAYGTLFNLAVCHEQMGKPATAWAEFRTVAAASELSRPDRAAAAREHEAKLRPLVSFLTVVVPADVRAPGMEIKVDQTRLEEPAWNTEIAVDPGEHAIEASAPGRLPRTTAVRVGPNGARERTTLEALALAPKPTVLPDGPTRRPTMFWVGLGVAGLGVVATGVGLAFGLAASSQNDEAKALCAADGTCPTAGAKDQASRTLADAKATGDIATAFVVGGLGVAALGGVLALTAKPVRAPAPTTAWDIRALAGGGQVTFAGAF